MKKAKKWCKGKTKKEIADEMWRLMVHSMDKDDVADLVINYTKTSEQKEFVDGWHDQDCLDNCAECNKGCKV